MSVNDPIADFLTRIRNAHMAKQETVEIPHSKMKAEISRILLEEGYVQDVSERGSGVEKRLVIALKYGPDGSRGIAGLRRMSRPDAGSTASRRTSPACSTGSGWRYSRPPRGSLQTTRPGAGASAAKSCASSTREVLSSVENREGACGDPRRCQRGALGSQRKGERPEGRAHGASGPRGRGKAGEW